MLDVTSGAVDSNHHDVVVDKDRTNAPGKVHAKVMRRHVTDSKSMTHIYTLGVAKIISRDIEQHIPR
jgi:hypothetical protein